MPAQAGFRADNVAVAVNLIAQRFRAIQLLKAAVNISIPPASPISYSDMTARHRDVTCSPRVRAGFAPVCTGTTLNFAAIKFLFPGHSFHTSRWDYGYTGGSTEGGLTQLADKQP
jgi:hypothetical protein